MWLYIFLLFSHKGFDIHPGSFKLIAVVTFPFFRIGREYENRVPKCSDWPASAELAG